MMGEPAAPAAEPEPRDRRFVDPDWKENQFFDFLKQLYLITSRWATDMAEQAEGVDEHTRQKAGFYLRQLASALAPSNFVLTNPELLRETLATNGENLVRGMHLLAEDIKAGGGNLKIRQSAMDAFKLGENLAVTPGKVVHENSLCQIIQYAPTTKAVLKRPLVIVPPWINKFYILDLTPEKSFIRWCVDQGHTVFVISWVNPDQRQATKSFEHYMREGILEAVDVALKVSKADGVNAVGYCVGGTLLAVALAYMAAAGDDRIKSATLFATQVDFTHAGDLKVFVDEEQLADLEYKMNMRGYLEGSKMASAFNMLRPNDLIWPYVISNYFKGKPPSAFDLLYWNADATRMPAANHAFYLRNCYLENRLSKGEMVIGGVDPGPAQGADPDLQSRHPRGPHRAAALGVLRLVLFRRESDVRPRRLRPHRRRDQPSVARQVPVLDRAGAEGRPLRRLAHKGRGTPGLLVAALAGLDRVARREPGKATARRRRQDQGDRAGARAATSRSRPDQPALANARTLSPSEPR